MAEDQNQESAKKYGKIVAKAWSDPAFKQRLMENPAEVLKEEGVDVPAGIEVRVIETPESRRFFILPEEPPHFFHLPGIPASLEEEVLDEPLRSLRAEQGGVLAVLTSNAFVVWFSPMSHKLGTLAGR